MNASLVLRSRGAHAFLCTRCAAGGLGAADVAVTTLPAGGAPAASPLSRALRQLGKGSPGSGGAAAPPVLRCALMELELPVETLAAAVLGALWAGQG